MKFVQSQKNKSAACRVLGINRSTIYYKKKRKPDELEQSVIDIFKKHNSNYGSRRIKFILNRQGTTISKTRICNILKRNSLESKYGRKKLTRNIYTNKDERYISENLIKNVVATKPNQIVHTDFTEFKYNGGKLFVSGIVDAFDRTAVIAWDTRATKELVIQTINLLPVKPEILHSDRGSQYTSDLIREYAEVNNIKRSMSAPHRPCENACIETFWKTMKTEIGSTKHLTEYQLKLVLCYQLYYYNNERIHSSINYLTPYEKRALSFRNVS